MDVQNCRECGRLFNYLGGQRLCPGCKAKLEDKFQEVKKYIYENKDASISEVSEANDVSVQQIKQWVREERLSFSKDSAVGIECESCGVMIHTGRFCDACKKQIAANLGAMYSKKTVETPQRNSRENARMRFLDK